MGDLNRAGKFIAPEREGEYRAGDVVPDADTLAQARLLEADMQRSGNQALDIGDYQDSGVVELSSGTKAQIGDVLSYRFVPRPNESGQINLVNESAQIPGLDYDFIPPADADLDEFLFGLMEKYGDNLERLPSITQFDSAEWGKITGQEKMHPRQIRESLMMIALRHVAPERQAAIFSAMVDEILEKITQGRLTVIEGIVHINNIICPTKNAAVPWGTEFVNIGDAGEVDPAQIFAGTVREAWATRVLTMIKKRVTDQVNERLCLSGYQPATNSTDPVERRLDGYGNIKTRVITDYSARGDFILFELHVQGCNEGASTWLKKWQTVTPSLQSYGD